MEVQVLSSASLVAYYGQVVTHWWFWASLPVVLPLLFALDHALGEYSRRYWRSRGQDPPPRRHSYRLDAGSFVVYTAIAAVMAGIALIRGDWKWALGALGATVLLGWIALRRARSNVIG